MRVFLVAASIIIFPGLAQLTLGDQALKPAAESGLPDTSIYHLDSTWLDAHEQQVKITDLAGHLRIVAMLFTSCPGACPMTIQDIQHIRSLLPTAARAAVMVTVFSFDPERDTPEKLLAFKNKMKLEKDVWTLLTPEQPADVTALAAALGVRFKKLESGDFIHSNIIFLLDKQGEVVAKQEGLKTAPESFVAEIKKLHSQR